MAYPVRCILLTALLVLFARRESSPVRADEANQEDASVLVSRTEARATGDLADMRKARRVRVLVSYGTEWFPWFMRRLAERPANLWFVIRNLF